MNSFVPFPQASFILMVILVFVENDGFHFCIVIVASILLKITSYFDQNVLISKE